VANRNELRPAKNHACAKAFVKAGLQGRFNTNTPLSKLLDPNRHPQLIWSGTLQRGASRENSWAKP